MTKLIIIMVGLPARGKSYISQKLYRYFKWSGLSSKIFNAGDSRREKYPNITSEFFSPNNTHTRNNIAEKLFLELIEWIMIKENKIAIFDATNTTVNRRKKLIDTINLFKIDDLKICFIESICNIKDIINKNIEMKANSKNYIKKGIDTINDFNQRMLYYTDVYQQFNINEIENLDNYSYLKISNINELFTIYNVCGFLLSNVISFLLNLNINRNTIYLTRHGQSKYNILDKIGGNPSITDLGVVYSKKLYKYINNLQLNDLVIYISTLKRTKETIEPFIKNNYNSIIELKCLDEIDAGIYDSLTYKEIKEKYPEEYNNRKKDKLNYRYPRGESYKDLIIRAQKIIYEIENTDKPILIVSHQAILRVIYSYFMNIDNLSMTNLNIPLNTIIKLNPSSYQYDEERIIL
tara:strand:+ start:100 stop:1320 length:1221 start_codon:yes stop_codon:yes gene_type:complete